MNDDIKTPWKITEEWSHGRLLYAYLWIGELTYQIPARYLKTFKAIRDAHNASIGADK